ncbi:MAG: EI24 domain-containing protein [Rhodospirillales bacterium]|nr:MAG: EI24 domain-containing protein [Rhodospirillales bacterium]
MDFSIATMVGRSFGQLDDPRLRGSIALCAAIAVAFHVAVFVGALWLVRSMPVIELEWSSEYAAFLNRWLNVMVRAVAVGLAFTLPLAAFPVCLCLTNALVVDRVAGRCEARHYPHLAAVPAAPVVVDVVSGLRLLGLFCVANTLLTPMYVILLPFQPAPVLLFYAVNGWLIGDVLLRRIDARRESPERARERRDAGGSRVWLAGAAIACGCTIPLLNLVMPIVGVALVLHVARSLDPPAPRWTPPPA